jgi:hypothetical protein
MVDKNVNIPFAVGGATQQGVEHKRENQNNQDAVSILINDGYLIGVICDGCSSTHNNLQDAISNNEIGAKLIGYTILQDVEKNIRNNGVDDLFLAEVSNRVLHKLQKIVDIFCEEDEEKKELFIYDFLMSTIIGFIVTRDKYVIFHSGDGIIGINGDIQILEETGLYFGEKLLYICCPNKYPFNSHRSDLKVFSSGKASEINNIFLATDGFYEIVKNNEEALIDFIEKSTPVVKNGFNFLIREFRKKIIWNDAIIKTTLNTNLLKDDASFLLLRRLKK